MPRGREGEHVCWEPHRKHLASQRAVHAAIDSGAAIVSVPAAVRVQPQVRTLTLEDVVWSAG